MTRKRELSAEQSTAANPAENIWVSANAGTGKTSVLVQRLLRILFRTQNAGAGILCLTYTNAGASEMRNRILAALTEWATASDEELRDLLTGVAYEQEPTDTDLRNARAIFYNYIDHPQILKIKTIHGFCEEILRRFPIEAGVPPAWNLTSDANQRRLLKDAFHRLINRGANAEAANAFSHILGRISEHSFDSLLDVLTDQYKQFFGVENYFNKRQQFVDTTKQFFGLDLAPPPEVSRETLKDIVVNVKIELNSSKKPAAYLQNIIILTEQYIDTTINFEKYKTAYLNADGSKSINVSKKWYLAEEQDRIYAADQRNLNEQIFADTVALFDLGYAFSQTYKELKSERDLLDFDDLILYTKKLFSDPLSMGWVLSQLDVSLNHILVDEAQDTSPEQWAILKALTTDFFTDGDTESDLHSLFVVGDAKQSIYGFQGADPEEFAASREEISAQIKNNLRAIREIPLAQSFRSTAPILKTVDYVFNNIENFANTDHKCFRGDAPGRVEVHPLYAPDKAAGEKSAAARAEYIKKVAGHIENLVKFGANPSDIMVLVQRRNPFAAPLVNEIKKRGIAVAGSDRIILPEFPAVRDLLNLTRFCLDNTDDYSLACVLKSPMFRFSEDDLMAVCRDRGEQNVFNVLARSRPDIHAQLLEIIEWSRGLAPYSFFMRVLNTGDRRMKMIAALGQQIIDPLEEFLTICLSYERTQPGTLRHFIKWFIEGGSEIKRELSDADGVRVATVHGSKGLESPIVFLIDTVRTPRDKPEKIISVPGGWIWSPIKSNSELLNNASEDAMRVKIAEYNRLLYVAMTRARDQLYIYGFNISENAPEISWHSQLTQILPAMPGIKKYNGTLVVSNE
ncbi:MAG: UvrD-helicase domain-containing protein [Rickettsiales bacterium]|jgi:ATP-dependent helicase/nuclease subunit A|nr:UvrD-helicase domain-containing protein [Rickettsiales bacterium]